jgi:hypothetical protein
MRTITSFVAALAAAALSFGAQAQNVSNLDFETWTQRTGRVTGGVEAPANWQTTDDFLSYINNDARLPSSTATVNKTTDSHSGTFAAKLENKAVTFITGAPVVPGNLYLGTSLSTNYPYGYGGTAFNTRPAQVSFYYKMDGRDAARDSAYVSIDFSYTSSTGTSVLLGYADTLLTAPAATYSLVSMPVLYAPGSTLPDSVHITITSGVAGTLSTTSALYIDDITLGTITSSTRNSQLNAAVSVYPNPSVSGRFVLSAAEPALVAAPLTVTDVTGRVVLQGAAVSPAASRQLDLSAQKAGIYTLQLQTEKGVVTRKLVIQ